MRGGGRPPPRIGAGRRPRRTYILSVASGLAAGVLVSLSNLVVLSRHPGGGAGDDFLRKLLTGARTTSTDAAAARAGPAPAGPPPRGVFGSGGDRGAAGARGARSSRGLSCGPFGGPSDAVAAEMVYWEDLPSDDKYASPLRGGFGGSPPSSGARYLTFEKDESGWNNKRLAFENVVALAHAMGRTLVLPPEQEIEHLVGETEGRRRGKFGYADFFDLDSFAAENRGMDIITMDEFLRREAMSGRLADKATGIASFPPGDRTDWDGTGIDGEKVLNGYLRNVTHTPMWRTYDCIAAFPETTSNADTEALRLMREAIIAEGNAAIWKHGQPAKPIPVDASAMDRMREILLLRDVCVYDELMRDAQVVHFMRKEKLRLRQLVPFYTFLFFPRWQQGTYYKRLIRDHLRYKDELQCAAARIVHAVRDRAMKRHPSTNPNGEFDALHIRRGDFFEQFKDAKANAYVLFENSKNELARNGTIYIATDQADRSFFKPFFDHYDVCFLDDFKHLFESLSTNYYGMLDQLVASRSRVFFGTYYSTFSSYITRLMGYHTEKNKLPGYEGGTIDAYYSFPPDRKFELKQYAPVHWRVWEREFAVAWRDINKGSDSMI